MSCLSLFYVQMTSIVWLRRNLRLDDNRVIDLALHESSEVILTHLWDSERPTFGGMNRLAFLIESVNDLAEQCKAKGTRLVIRKGKTSDTLEELVRETGAKRVYYDNNYEHYEKVRDDKAFSRLETLGAECIGVKDNVLFESHEVRTGENKPYTVYTPFKKNAWQRLNEASSLTAVTASYKAPNGIDMIVSYELPTLYKLGHDVLSPQRLQHGGSSMANAIWSDWKNNIGEYNDSRDKLYEARGTSKLSAHLKFGTISTRRLIRESLELSSDPSKKQGAETYISELLWREFYYKILQSFPYVESEAFQKRYSLIKWEKNEAHLKAWKEGRTGVPIVDAAMRELLTTGYMHNRARMIVASFLTKDLLINWQEGEMHFMKYLTDGDIAQNNGGWQWSASTGTDAQPYYRIFNPYLQSKRFDPNGEYIKRYVPELTPLPAKYIHEPHLLSPIELATFGLELDKDYPYPIVDHYVQREKAKAMFEAVKDIT
jgi:deoxyribodipyrimidine photo-lyase